ncbi:curlin repeat-containing protein [Bradyrhizobium sp.]|uniref:curlin repeat-containing protein n=1 Tax=Bradyrhizobium sp. TaxID=376 RepID=UPI0023831A1D|nr:curlin repeat-containing protein [Bradyrhizobium sp.]MDE1935924.1 curlin repeat-containing protein [Bradyrhizobium sp.]
MRVVTGSVLLLMIAAEPVSSGEAFITQVTNRTVASEQAAAAVATSASASAMLALPVKPGALNQFVQPPAAVPGTNISSMQQFGVNNFAAVTQTGNGNASAIVQRGSGNQAVVTQRNPH